jgi:glutamate/tyrosine decarboxylase-like PLP-dependent enzyme
MRTNPTLPATPRAPHAAAEPSSVDPFHATAAEPAVRALAALEAATRELEPTSATFETWLAAAARVGVPLAAPRADALVFDATPPPAELGAGFGGGETVSAALETLARHVLSSGVDTNSGRFLGFVPGGSLPLAAVGELLGALSNRFSGMAYGAPGAVAVENAVIQWLCRSMGLPSTAWGSLASGGSLATLTALVAARATRKPEAWARSVVYLTSETHHAVTKALHLAGLGHVTRREVPTDAGLRLDPAALAAMVQRDEAMGLSPWIVVATAGTTNTGALDPLEAVADVAERHGLWLHVDAAYGGFFRLAPSGAAALEPLARADSLVLDPHKALFMPLGSGAVLVKNGEALRRALGGASSPYLAQAQGQLARSPADYSLELSRPFRALPLWLALRVYGESVFAAALEEKLTLARYAYARLEAVPGLALFGPPDLSCLALRAAEPTDAAANAATEALGAALAADGRFFTSETTLGGRLYLRCCILGFRTHRGVIDEFVAAVAAARARSHARHGNDAAMR